MRAWRDSSAPCCQSPGTTPTAFGPLKGSGVCQGRMRATFLGRLNVPLVRLLTERLPFRRHYLWPPYTQVPPFVKTGEGIIRVAPADDRAPQALDLGREIGRRERLVEDSEPVGHHALVIEGHVRRVHPILGQHSIHIGELADLRDPDPHVSVLARAQRFVERADLVEQFPSHHRRGRGNDVLSDEPRQDFPGRMMGPVAV
jgi:hypothetical protein